MDCESRPHLRLIEGSASHRIGRVASSLTIGSEFGNNVVLSETTISEVDQNPVDYPRTASDLLHQVRSDERLLDIPLLDKSEVLTKEQSFSVLQGIKKSIEDINEASQRRRARNAFDDHIKSFIEGQYRNEVIDVDNIDRSIRLFTVNSNADSYRSEFDSKLLSLIQQKAISGEIGEASKLKRLINNNTYREDARSIFESSATNYLREYCLQLMLRIKRGDQIDKRECVEVMNRIKESLETPRAKLYVRTMINSFYQEIAAL